MKTCDNKSKIDLLERVRIDATEFDLKGLSLDAVIDLEISQLNSQVKITEF